MNRPETASGSPHDLPTALPAGRRERLHWLDLFRGAAVLWMIQVHVVNTFMAGGLRSTAWFAVLNFTNGLVAPSFLFIAGFVQGWERRQASDRPINFARRASRLLGLVGIGYALHFPFGELGQQRWTEALRVGTQADILQCLAVSLAVLLGMTWVASRFSRRAGNIVWGTLLSGLLLAVVFLAAQTPTWLGWPVPLQAYLNQSTGSLFQLLPWAGFVFFGALVGASWDRRLWEKIAAVVVLGAGAWLLRASAFSALSPSSFMERAAIVLVFALISSVLSRRFQPALLAYAGKHSLALYVVHLVLIYDVVVRLVSTSVQRGVVTMALVLIVGVLSLTVVHLLPLWPVALSSISAFFSGTRRQPESVPEA